MTLLKVLLLGALLSMLIGPLLALVSRLTGFNRKRLQIVRAASAATDEQLERVYALIEQSAGEAPNGGVLARTNRTTTDVSCVIPLPASIDDFPWAGRTIAVEATRDVTFRFVEETAPEARLLGKLYRYVPMRTQRPKSGKTRTIFAPKQYLAANRQLAVALSDVCSKYPAELLAHLLLAGLDSFEFDSIHQARIGTNPAWAQSPEYQVCEQCHKRMVLIVQLPGTMVHPKNFHSGSFFLFGCKTHPQNTKTVQQYA